MKTAENGGSWPLLNRADAGRENDALLNKEAFGRKFIRRGMAWRVMTVTRIYAYDAVPEERLASGRVQLHSFASGHCTRINGLRLVDRASAATESTLQVSAVQAIGNYPDQMKQAGQTASPTIAIIADARFSWRTAMNPQSSKLTLDAALASKFATLALGHLTREYPNKLEHVMGSAADVKGPRALHPIFYGSFDWHSCVHGYWLIARLLDRFPDLPEAPQIRALIDDHFTAANVAAEVAYLERPEARGFERPYGWAWLLALAGQLESMKTPDGQRWAGTLRPLASAFVDRFTEFLPKSTYPLRVGTHFNTAFALTLSVGYAREVGNASFETLIIDTARRWYLNDVACQAWEPAGDEFLSSSLMEAELMRRVLPEAEFEGWFDRFLPKLAAREPATLFTPATVTDRTDGKLAHLDGLNLSRAWCQRSLARSLKSGDARISVLEATAHDHLAAGLAHVAGDYMGEHWLATFALLALEA